MVPRPLVNGGENGQHRHDENRAPASFDTPSAPLARPRRGGARARGAEGHRRADPEAVAEVDRAEWRRRPMSLRAKIRSLTPCALRMVVPLATVAIGWCAMVSGVAHAQTPAMTGVVHSPAGDLRGLAADRGGEFLGIPYAAPPVGELRWRPPHDAAGWPRTLQAAKFGDTCAQPQRGVFAAPSHTEDCLYLNVFAPETTPDPAPRRAGHGVVSRRRPVQRRKQRL